MFKGFMRSKPTSASDRSICFIHGITGNREATWTAEGDDGPWPKKLLPSKLQTIRILGFGYAADVVHLWKMVNKGRVFQFGQSLLQSLYAKRSVDGTADRPIAFLTHSLGGLVCEACLLQSHQSADEHLKSVINSTVAIAFFGTPHAGAGSLADWATRSAHVVGLLQDVNVQIVSVLRKDSQVLEILQNQFHNMLRDREPNHKIDITSFYEQVGMPGIGLGFTSRQVVPPNSAILPRWKSVPLNKAHNTMTKLGSVDDPAFELICAEIFRWVNAAKKQRGSVATSGASADSWRPQNEKQIAAMQHKEIFNCHYDPSSDDVIFPVATRLLKLDSEYTVQFPEAERQLGFLQETYQLSGWLAVSRRFCPTDVERDLLYASRPISLVPYVNHRFLACVPTVDLYRVLASRVSVRQSYDSHVLVHSTMISVSKDTFNNQPLVEIRYADDPHYGLSTSVPSQQFATSIVGTGGIKPQATFNFEYNCSVPGYEAVSMPNLMCMFAFQRHAVIFSSQFQVSYTLWRFFTEVLDTMWDHDDAWECGEDQIPIKVHVEEYLTFAKDFSSPVRDGLNYWTLKSIGSVLTHACYEFFVGHPKRQFEIEDILRFLQSARKMLADEHHSKEEYAGSWYRLYGTEMSRWLLLAQTLTLGSNISRVWPLPGSFDILREHASCYVN
ncbi:hypothetical protein M752DRAFT_300648 [Aspergillus phoenicis ATCC 13157]|uniref:DUF676 domain-containing protein n=1 Tax=Aspergillus phoenicis ATCC 13157 TaxID=1353007 RepID=A0A370PJQ6_ASPPH|nr:hypothetical protein M752DRAFT_300648 [Aspergillus phoenicis ATCC 13157]